MAKLESKLSQHNSSLRLQPHLKHTDEGLREVVEVAAFGPVVEEVEFASKHLHPQEREDDDEEEEKKEQGGDGAHRVEERGYEVAQRRPVPEKRAALVINAESCDWY